MKVKLTTDRAGPYGAMQYEGEIIDLPDAEAQRLVAAGQAEPPEQAPAKGKSPAKQGR